MRPQACMIIICVSFWALRGWLIISQCFWLTAVEICEEMRRQGRARGVIRGGRGASTRGIGCQGRGANLPGGRGGGSGIVGMHGWGQRRLRDLDSSEECIAQLVRRICGKVAAQPEQSMKFCIRGQFYMLNKPGIRPHQIFDWHHLKILCFLVCKAIGAEPLTLSLRNFFWINLTLSRNFMPNFIKIGPLDVPKSSFFDS